MGDLTNHFSRSEFACNCGCGDDRIDLEFVEMLEDVRLLLERSITITSGVRCRSYNEEIGGVKTSAHLPIARNDGKGEVARAADIYVPTSTYRHMITPLLWARFQRIGFGKQFYHVDTLGKGEAVLWDYYESDHVA